MEVSVPGNKSEQSSTPLDRSFTGGTSTIKCSVTPVREEDGGYLTVSGNSKIRLQYKYVKRTAVAGSSH